MTGKTHLVGGLLAGTTTALVLQATGTDLGLMNNVTIVASSAVGSLIPDIDHPQSMAAKKFPLLSIPFAIVAWISKLFGIKAMTHRGITHSLVPWILLALPLIFLYEKIGLVLAIIWGGVIIGAISHLIFDALNPSGIPWLYPILPRSKKLKLLPKPLQITTKNMVKNRKGVCKEDVFCFLAIVVEALLLLTLVK